MRPRADTLLVWTGAPCTYGCGTCPIDPDGAPGGIQVADLVRALAEIPDREGRLVVLVGGEPFLRSDIFRLIAGIRMLGCVPGVVTTGRPLVYPQVRQRLRQAGIAYVRLQLFGIGDAHDRIAAVPGAFEQASNGVRTWIAESGTACDVDVALNVRRRSIDTIGADVERLAREIPSPDVQIVVAIDPPMEAGSTDSERIRAAVAALATLNDDPARPSVAWEGLPASSAFVDAPAAVPLLTRRFIAAAPPACCLGSQHELIGSDAIGQQVQANSFNYLRTATTVPWTADPDACTAHTASEAIDRHRHLWLVEGDQLVLHVTDTGDFGPNDIARVKAEWSHLFIDQAPAGVLDDFTEGMRRVLPDATCDACAHRERCGRRFTVVDGPPFAREEAWIAAYIAGLRGRVLDVGCGEQLYRAELEPLVRSGAVQYTGLDPDEPSLARLRAALPQARFVLGGIEDFRGQPASYDHILCLRSLNHVVDLDESLARMADLLTPGGALLIVECTPFAMLRRSEQVAAADRAPRAGHQHFRNVPSEHVLPFARRRALRVLEHRPASLPTTNEWILLLGRPE